MSTMADFGDVDEERPYDLQNCGDLRDQRGIG